MSMRYLEEHAVSRIASDKKFFPIGSFVVTGCHADGASSRELTEKGVKTRVVSVAGVGEAPGRSKQEATSCMKGGNRGLAQWDKRASATRIEYGEDRKQAR
jgi:hypothetical protein